MRLKLHQPNYRGRQYFFEIISCRLQLGWHVWRICAIRSSPFATFTVLLSGARHLWSRAWLPHLHFAVSTFQNPYQFDFCKGIQPEFGRRDLAQQSGELDFGIWLQPESGTCDLAKQSAELDVWWSILAEFGRRDLARHFEHIALQWCSGQLFAMRECKRLSYWETIAGLLVNCCWLNSFAPYGHCFWTVTRGASLEIDDCNSFVPF